MNRKISKGQAFLTAATLVALGPVLVGPLAPAAAADTVVSAEMPTFTVANTKGAMHYYLYVPPTAKPGAPLIVHLHGGNNDAVEDARKSKLNELALAKGFAVAYRDCLNNGV